MKIGDVVQKVTMARFSRTLSTLVAAGVDIVKALEITGATAGNWVVEEALTEVRVRVHEGVPIAEPLVAEPGLPADGQPDDPDRRRDRRAREDARQDRRLLRGRGRRLIQSLTSIIEPLMMIGVGIMVGVIVISMYLPMFKMLQLVK